MKIIIALILCAFTMPAFASGRLSLQASEYSGHGGIYPMLGLSVDEKILGPVFVTGWAGYGQRPTEEGEKEWASGKFGFEARFKYFNVGAGAFANSGQFDVEEAGIENGAYAKVSLKLW